MRADVVSCLNEDDEVKNDEPSYFHIRYSDRTHRLTDIHALTGRSPYFESLLQRWNHRHSNDDGGGNDTLAGDQRAFELPIIDFASEQSVWAVLLALEHGRFSEEDQESLSKGGDSLSLDLGIVEVAFFLGAEEFVLPLYCRASRPDNRVRLALELSRRNYTPNQIEKLLSSEHYFAEVNRESVPLHTELCLSVPIARVLLLAYREARPRGIVASSVSTIASFFSWKNRKGDSGSDKDGRDDTPEPLMVEMFAMLTLVRFCGSRNWERDEDLRPVLDFLPVGADAASSAVSSVPKPDHLEDLLCHVIRRQWRIPDVFCQASSWPVDPVAVVPALIDAGRLPSLAFFVNRVELLAHLLVETWPFEEEAIENLRRDVGGFRRLVESQADGQCAWMAQVPQVSGLYRTVAVRCGDSAQQLVHRRVFMHLDFDPTIPPSLLETLPLTREVEAVTEKALRHGVMYLEHGNLEALNLPWEKASRDLTQRAAAALQDHEAHPVWRRLNVALLSGDWLYCVPANVLAVHAVREARQAREAAVTALQESLQGRDSCNALQSELNDLRAGRVRNLEKNVAQLKKEIKNMDQTYREISSL